MYIYHDRLLCITNMILMEHLEVDGVVVASEEEFEYMVSTVTWDNECSKDILIQIIKHQEQWWDSAQYGRAKARVSKPSRKC